MKKTVDGGFLIESDRLSGKVFVLQKSWNDGFKGVFNDMEVIGIRLSKSAGWNSEDLRFLTTLPPLKSVEVYNWDVKDISALSSHTGLQHIGLECQFGSFDFSQFINLAYLGMTWRPSAETLFNCRNLRYLNIDRFPYDTLEELNRISSLERLVIQSRKLRILSGAESLKSLRHLELAFCTSLDDVSSLNGCEKLERLEITSCKKIYDIDVVEHLPNLKTIRLENCDKIKSAKSLASCNQLEEAYFIATDIEDGDISMFLKLPRLKNVAFPRRKKYSHSMDEVNEALSAK